jgi:hypothetical protein
MTETASNFAEEPTPYSVRGSPRALDVEDTGRCY